MIVSEISQITQVHGFESLFLQVTNESVFSHLRLNMFPDGGIARIRTFGIVAKPENPDRLVRYRLTETWPGADFSGLDETLVDLLSVGNGSVCVGFSDAHYGHPRNMAKSGKGFPSEY